MKKIQRLFIEERKGLNPWDSTPPDALLRIAKRCGPDEIAAIHISIMYFKSELAMTPEWDGDTQDDIWKAIEQLNRISKLI